MIWNRQYEAKEVRTFGFLENLIGCIWGAAFFGMVVWMSAAALIGIALFTIQLAYQMWAHTQTMLVTQWGWWQDSRVILISMLTVYVVTFLYLMWDWATDPVCGDIEIPKVD